jgi:DNA mismatch endonuclease, patch repair protein
MDRLTKAQRSELMAKIHAKNTGPEILIRRLLHKLGFRFRLHRADLPGKPDIAFIKLRKVIFVNGCFWHAHQCKHGKIIPLTNRNYWIKKRRRNSNRDRVSIRKLQKDGWSALTVWECELRNLDKLAEGIMQFLRH